MRVRCFFRRWRRLCPFPAAAIGWLTLTPLATLAQDLAPALVSDTPHELFGAGDFDGDGRADLVIVDKASGKFRLGYQLVAGVFTWEDCRPSGLKDIAGFSIGKLLATNRDALVFSSPDANQIAIVDVSRPAAPAQPLIIPFTAALGPNAVVAADIGGSGKSSLQDLYITSIYNSPDANMATLLRNTGVEFSKIADAPLPGPAAHANRLILKAGQPPFVCFLVNDPTGDTFRAEDVSTGNPVTVATATGLPAGSDYTAGIASSSSDTPYRELIFYKPGESSLALRPIEEPAPGRLQFGKVRAVTLDRPTRQVIGLAGGRLLIIFGAGESAGVFELADTKSPAPIHTLQATNELFTCAAALPDGFIIFSEAADGKFSTKYQILRSAGAGFVPGPYGGLPSLADNDNITLPEIYARIAASADVKEESQMRPYTNAIPGTKASYAMVPISGGEFVMGSPDAETGRKPDEGPQHRVKISPFWMGRCEVTWNEYELFMYPEEERRIRAIEPTDPAGDKLADVVTHPSRPYVEMSFGMGKEGFPAISMTQHAANKYCQWLSAKTGQFYRLPTEAEWEYACRAGTTNAYFFGDDPSKLGEYAWFEDNSNFKYQKVGKKKPNPWGLYDMCGNVVEWVLDQYDPDFYKQCADQGTVSDPWNKAAKPYPHSVRGGSWDDEAVKCRSAARRGSDRSWKMQDPQLPKSIWYHSDAQWVGFRILRPLKIPTADQMQKYWTSGVERD